MFLEYMSLPLSRAMRVSFIFLQPSYHLIPNTFFLSTYQFSKCLTFKTISKITSTSHALAKTRSPSSRMTRLWRILSPRR